MVAVLRGLRCLIPGPRCLGGHRSRVAGPRGCFWPHIGASGVPDCSGSPRGRPERCGTVGDISATDWEAIARQAEAAGDREGAQAARKVAERGGVAGNGQESVFAIAKKLAKVALKHGRIFLPKTIRSWADKIYGLVDSIEATSELGIATFLTQNGIPADVAIEIARWIVTFA